MNSRFFLKALQLFAGVVFILMQAGCTDTILYNSTQPPLNLTTKSGEIYGTANIGGTGQNYTIGFAPGEHIQVAASYGYHKIKGSDENTRYTGQEYMLGYFNKFDAGLVLEGFFGVGMGDANSMKTSTTLFGSFTDTTRLTGEYNKQFLQLNIGRKQGYVESGVSIRCSKIKYTGVEKSLNNKITYTGSPESLLWEPVIFGKAGTEYFKVMVTAGWVYVPGVVEITHDSMFINVGALLHFNL